MKEHPLQKRLHAEGNPLIDDDVVTFLWEGKSAPELIDDLHRWEESPQRLKRLGAGLWAVSFSLAADAYLEYSFRDPKSKKRFRDPFNKNRIYNGVGSYNNFFYMPGASPSPWTKVNNDIDHGKITRHEIETWMLGGRGKRTVHLYHPPTLEPAPLLVVYDGNDYLQRGKITTILDNLIAQKRIRPIALALLQNGGQHRRFIEYADSDATLSWLRHDVLPLAHRKLKLTDERGAFGVLGASMGGLMSMYTGLRMPETFGRIISQSGVFSFEGLDCSVVDLIRYAPRSDVKIWMDVGKMDFLLEDNRRMQPILKEQGYNITYRENGGAHNFTTWRDSLSQALISMFG
ncbi:MAG: esterase family protein [Chloroflexi bacterium]|nr:esterase family protein [Chloroflexota bacterium]